MVWRYVIHPRCYGHQNTLHVYVPSYILSVMSDTFFGSPTSFAASVSELFDTLDTVNVHRIILYVVQTQTTTAYCRILPIHSGPPRLRYLFQVVQTKPRQLNEEYYLHWTTTFEISFSGSSNTNHDSLLLNTTYTRPPRLRYLFQVVQTKPRQLNEEYYLH